MPPGNDFFYQGWTSFSYPTQDKEGSTSLVSFQEPENFSRILNYPKFTALPVLAGNDFLQVFHLKPVFYIKADTVKK
jgi:hypothetical protein